MIPALSCNVGKRTLNLLGLITDLAMQESIKNWGVKIKEGWSVVHAISDMAWVLFPGDVGTSP